MWETIARQLANKMILQSISVYVLAIRASWHVWAKYDNLLLASWNIQSEIDWLNVTHLRVPIIVLKHKFLSKLSVFMETLKTCAIVPTLVVIFLSFLFRNCEWITNKILLKTDALLFQTCYHVVAQFFCGSWELFTEITIYIRSEMVCLFC